MDGLTDSSGVASDGERQDPMTSRIENGVEYKSMVWWYVGLIEASFL